MMTVSAVFLLGRWNMFGLSFLLRVEAHHSYVLFGVAGRMVTLPVHRVSALEYREGEAQLGTCLAQISTVFSGGEPSHLSTAL